MPDTDDDDKHVCYACIGEAYLSARMQETGKVAACSYCGETDECWTVEDLAEEIEAAFKRHYYRTSDAQPEWERSGMPVLDAIEDAAGVPREVAEDVLAILADKYYDHDAAAMGEESEFDADSYYDEKGPDDQSWREEWRNFERSLKTEARFFSQTAATHLAAIFGEIDKLKTHDGRPLVVAAGPGTALDDLYRARVFQSERALKEALCHPDSYLGSPPANAARAGRMNALGVSVFYGATDASVAVAEVRPPVGSNVAVARFALIRPLRLLDLTIIEDVQDRGSIFDASLERRLERVAFLRTLGQRITKPVMPDDEAFEYLSTQAVADYLATMNEPRLDGIVFPSAQSKAGCNVVLFHRAARVEVTVFPEGAEITASTGYETEDGWEVDYSVSERVPPGPMPPPPEPGEGLLALLPDPGEPPNWSDDFREAALRIDPETVAVHHVNWVDVNATRFEVRRHRFEKR